MLDNDKIAELDAASGLTEPMMGRRDFLRFIATGSLAATLSFVSSCDAVAKILGKEKALSVAAQRAKIAKMNKGKKPGDEIPWNNKSIIKNLTEGLSPVEARKRIFEFVQSFPYGVRKFTPKGGTELYDEEGGDCRHKSDALYNLFKEMGYEVRRLDVAFDWADLPIPKEILAEKKKSGTRAFHDAIEMKIDGKWVYVDPTWNQELKAKGFPVATWDGVRATREVTTGPVKKIPAGTFKTFEEYLKAEKIPWPVRSETDAFNKKLNTWLSQ